MAVGEPVRYEILGPLRVRRGAQEVPVDRADLKALLAVLLIEANAPVLLPRIIEAVWPYHPPADPATAVAHLFTDLDRLIDPTEPDPTGGRLVALTNGSYMLCVEAGNLDSGSFGELYEQARRLRQAGQPDAAAAALRQALGMWRDEPLAGLRGQAFAAARSWISGYRRYVLEELAEIELEQNAAELLRKVTRWVTEYPLSERLRAVKMIALDRVGRDREALGTFDEFQELTLAHRGFGASAALTDLRRRIELRQPGLPVPSAEIVPPLVPAVPKPPTATWVIVVLKVLGGAIPLASLSIANPLLFAFLAIKRRSFALAASAVGYTGAIYLAMEVLGDVSGGLVLLAGMICGAVQAAVVIGRRRR